MDRDEKQLKYWYESGAAGYEKRIRNLFSFYDSVHIAINSMLRSILAPESELLIVGAGTGGEIVELGQTNRAWRFLGVDPAQPMLNIASERIRAAGLSDRVLLVKGFVGELPEGTLYDAATVAMVLHFLPDNGGKLTLLRDTATRLRSGASLVLMDLHGDLSAPESKLLCEAWKHQQNLAGVKWEEVEQGMTDRMKTIHFVAGARIEQLLVEAGFQRVQRFFQNFLLGGWLAFKP